MNTKITAKQLATELVEKFKTTPEHYTAGRLHVFSAEIAIGNSTAPETAPSGVHRGKLVALTTPVSVSQTYHIPEPKHSKHSIWHCGLELTCRLPEWRLVSEITLVVNLTGHDTLGSYVKLVRHEIESISELASEDANGLHWLNKLRKEQSRLASEDAGTTVILR